MIYPEEEYLAFYQAFVDFDPRAADELEEKEVIAAYNQIKKATPNITIAQIKMVIPPIAEQVMGKMGGGEDVNKNKINALNSVALGE